MDDIRTGREASESVGKPDDLPDGGTAPVPPRRSVGPESEVRGGPEANEKPLPPERKGLLQNDQ